ncbi:transcriptional regulator FtrA [Gluconacetobacter azotocaptans]|uniref:transcriptional regulator FtrA n=1 Tax=Gluconacetobacter azotocaptans TaxID=142834 RepID=UPI0019593266|nr:transcriptional regulator FtrA [Gluconacetobacter azotocaptans]MBM9402435.1 transcriptional regulator FtrA [Gluconacetobacter azotocaptans]
MSKTTAPLVALLVYDRLCLFEFGCAFEVFGLSRPEMGAGWYRCAIVAAEPGPLHGQGGVTITADGDLSLLQTADTIVIPGWRGPAEAAPAPLLHALRAANRSGRRIVSICGGAFVLAQAGLLDGKRATTHWHHAAALAAAYPAISVDAGALYVENDNILTSAGSAAGLDLCIHVVRKDFGTKAANLVARRLVVAAHRGGGQSQFIERAVPPPAGDRLSRLLDALRGRLAERWTMERMAAVMHVSVRSLHRHIRDATGLAPGTWLLRQRLRLAEELLEETTLSIEAIALRAGFGTAANLRQHFRAVTGVTPTAYRLQFATRREGEAGGGA